MALRLPIAIFVLALLLCGGGGGALADEPDPERAKALYVEAKRLHEEGRVRESMTKLQEAYEAYPSQGILISIVNRHVDLGEIEEAAELLQHIEAKRGKLKREVTRLQRKIDKALATPVMVRLTADASDATVSIDGGEPTPLPLRVELSRGSHTFTFRAAGRADVEQTEVLKGIVELPISVNLPVPTGTWRVTVTPPIPLKEVRLLLDGEDVKLGRSELSKPVTEPREVIPGAHKLTCLRGFEARADAEFTINSGDAVALTCAFPVTDEGGIPILGVVTGGAALLSLASGIGVLAQHYSELPGLEAKYPWPRYRIESSKPAAGGVLVGVGVGLSVLSALFFAEVFE